MAGAKINVNCDDFVPYTFETEAYAVLKDAKYLSEATKKKFKVVYCQECKHWHIMHINIAPKEET